MIILPTNYTDDCLEPQVVLAKELVSSGIAYEKIIFCFVCVPDSKTELSKSLRFVRDRAGFDAIEEPLPLRVGYSEAQDSGYAVSETRYNALNGRADKIAQAVMNKLTTICETEEEVEGVA